MNLSPRRFRVDRGSFFARRRPDTPHSPVEHAFRAELACAYSCLDAGAFDAAYKAFERAHVLGQRRTRLHVQAHVGFLRWGFRRRVASEIAGQLVRIVAAALFTWLWMPLGNTGGARVGILRQMPIPDSAKALLEKSRRPAG